MEKLAILALSFGKPFGGSLGPNEANLQIAKCAERMAKSLNATLFRDASVPGLGMHGKVIGKGLADTHESTIELLEKALKKMQELEITEVQLVTATPYAWRAFRDARKVFAGSRIEVMRVNTLRKIWFFPDSSQPWTTSPWRWWPREIILRAMPFKLYAWITKKLA